MTEQEPYGSAAAVEAAIRSAAQKSFASDPSVSISERIRQEHFRRFLSRVFSEGEESEWLLKGGMGMLARVPSSRATKDVDLYRSGFTLDQALDDLKRLADVDLGDHFRFVYVSHIESLDGNGQPYTNGYKVHFDVYVGVKKRSSLNVDLAVGTGLTADVSRHPPANGLDLPRLVSHEYRLYPVVDQIADKVCATMMLYSGKASTREKDLVDLVVLAVTQKVESEKLHIAIRSEGRRRGLASFEIFIIPKGWGAAYTKMAASVPYCADFLKVDDAQKLVAEFVNPVLKNRRAKRTWDPELRTWVT